LWECRQRDEERRAEYEHQRAEAEAIARSEAAIALAENNRRARIERQERINREVSEREIADLRFQVRQNQVWQSGVQRAVRNTIADQQRQTLMGELEKMLSPPAPPPEPENLTEIVYVSEDEQGSPHLGHRDFNPRLWTKI